MPHLRSVRVPTLVLWGRLDPLFPLAHAERAVAMRPDARLHVIEDAAHWPYLEQAGEFNRVMLEFLAEQEGPRSIDLAGGRC